MRYGWLISLLLLFYGLTAVAATNPAGQVIIVNGILQAIKANQTEQVLKRGDYFYSGEILKTAAQTQAQVRFTDGTVMSIFPNSQVKIKQYDYQKNAKTDKNILTLAQGGFRALTGLISKANPNNYQVSTPVAVIGVRGTNYTAVFNNKHLYVGVWQGRIVVNNKKGGMELGLPNKYNYAMVVDSHSAPMGLLNPPAILNACHCDKMH